MKDWWDFREDEEALTARFEDEVTAPRSLTFLTVSSFEEKEVCRGFREGEEGERGRRRSCEMAGGKDLVSVRSPCSFPHDTHKVLS